MSKSPARESHDKKGSATSVADPSSRMVPANQKQKAERDQELLQDCRSGDGTKAQEILQKALGEDELLGPETVRRALALASANPRPGPLQALLDHQGGPCEKGRRLFTPSRLLAFHARLGNTEAVIELLEQNDFSADEEHLALRWSCNHHHAYTALAILTHLELEEKDPQCALGIFASIGHTDGVQNLLAQGADPQRNNHLALRAACAGGHRETASILLARYRMDDLNSLVSNPKKDFSDWGLIVALIRDERRRRHGIQTKSLASAWSSGRQDRRNPSSLMGLVLAAMLGILSLFPTTYCVASAPERAAEAPNPETAPETTTDTDPDACPGIVVAKKKDVPPAPWGQGVSILVQLNKQRAWLYKDGEFVSDTAVTTGRRGKETPTGDFSVSARHRHWTSTLYHASMPYFLRLEPGGDFGLHQGKIMGRPASHGCIRLPPAAAKAFFEASYVGTPVRIEK